MTTKELRDAAERLGIDISECRYKREIEALVLPALESPERVDGADATERFAADTAVLPPEEGVVPARVYGFVRSGNHLLASLLSAHIYPRVNCSAHIRGGATGHWSQRHVPSPLVLDGQEQDDKDFVMAYARCLGTHLPPGETKRPRTGKRIYIYRDGRDVALSLYRWEQARRVDQKDISFSQFIRQNLDWRNSPGGKAVPRRNYSLICHWRDHLAAWKDAAVLVRYEDLLANPVAEMSKIADALGRPLIGTPSTGTPVGWNPSGDHRIRKWKKAWGDTDLAYFDAVVPEDFYGRF